MLTTPWRPNNGAVLTSHLFAIGDVHGQAKMLGRLLDHIDTIQPSAGREREIVFLGDLIDRGPDSLGSVALAMGAEARCDRRTILPGNHELMLFDAIDCPDERFLHWFNNGGHAVMTEVDPHEALGFVEAFAAIRLGLPDGFEDMMRHGVTHLIRDRVLMVHAGLMPWVNARTFLDEPRDTAPWAWVRDPFLNHRAGWKEQDLDLVIHGHTPATIRPIEHTERALDLLDHSATLGRICLDAGAMRLPQVACVEFLGDQHRLHIAEAPAPLPVD